MNKCQIAQTLLSLRTAAGLTQETVARSLSVSNKTVSKWENGASMPDLEMLIALADYYGVSTDFLLGRAEEKAPPEEDIIVKALAGLSAAEAFTRAFALAQAIIPAEYPLAAATFRETQTDTALPPPMDPRAPRDAISRHDFYHFTENSDELTMAVMLMQGRDDFAFLREPASREKLTRLFTFLADPDVLRVLSFIHSARCSESFTNVYMAQNTGLTEERTEKILAEAAALHLCSRSTAHLVAGDITIYTARGEGNLLALLALAHVQISRKGLFGYHFDKGCKMIKGGIA